LRAGPARSGNSPNRNRRKPGSSPASVVGEKRWLAEYTQPGSPDSELGQVLDGADVFIGVSSAGLLGEQDVARMAAGTIFFALANPDSEIDPEVAQRSGAPDQQRAGLAEISAACWMAAPRT